MLRSEVEYLRLVLFMGLVLHKVVWESLKRKYSYSKQDARPSQDPAKKTIKVLKVGILIFLLFQTLFLKVFPISYNPTVLKILGTSLFLVGLTFAIAGRIRLGKNWVDIEDLVILPDHILVTTGIYRYIRHAIYAGDLLLLIGLEIALQSWLVIGVLLLIPVILKQAKAEEALLLQVFPEYKSYRARTKRFIPFVL